MGADTADLRDLVTRHGVRYEVCPHYEMTHGEKMMVGFDLELSGTHDHGHARLSPGCPSCDETYADLKTMAEAILPPEDRATDYEILPFDHALHISPHHPASAEVLLSLRVEHKQHYFSPVDECEESCLKEMLDKLAALGVLSAGGIR